MMKSLALRNGELDALRSGIAYVLVDRSIDCRRFYLGRFRVTNEWTRELLYIAWRLM